MLGLGLGRASTCSLNEAELGVVMDDERAVKELVAELAEARWPRSCPAPVIWTIDRAMVMALAEREERRQKWAVTVVGDHFYVDVEGRTLNGAVVRVG